MSAPSREYRIYLALWRKAYREDKEITIHAPSLGAAVAMRQGMYRAIRPFREEAMNDEELKKASEKFVLYLDKGEKASDPHKIIFRERKALQILEGAWDELGLREEDLLLGDERALQSELTQILENTATVKPNPFFTRD